MVAFPPFGRRARRFALGLALVSAAGATSAQYPGAAAAAQYPTGAIVQPLPQAGDPAERLASALRTLAVSPRDLSALLSAGTNALTLGDPNAAVGFFGRASEIAPRDGRVKAGLAGALVALEKPRDALRYFQEASAFGVADVDLAPDRGLAYDLVGDTGHAQRDYQTVLAAHPDDDATRRRLALSQGIAGNRAAAIATLDPLIRKRDIAAWRAQTFVLAMTGDAKGANDITRIMLPQQAAMLQPFLVRLAALSPADKARAVHFGEMPSGGRSYAETQLASVGPAPTYAPAPVAAAPARVAAPAPAAVAVAHSDLAPVRVAAAPVVTAAPSSAIAFVPPTIAAMPRPVPTPALGSEVGTIAMPLGSSALSGHYDLPHDSMVRRAVPRPVQVTARPPLAVPPRSIAPIEVATAVVPPSPARTAPMVIAQADAAPAGRLHKPVLAADQPAVAPTRRTRAAASESDEPATKTRSGAKSRPASTDATDDTTPAKGRHGTRTAARGEADDTAPAKTGTKKSRSAARDDAADDATSPAKKAKGKPRAAARDERTADDAPTRTAKSAKARTDDAAGPSKIYVQVAGGANRDDMDKAWSRVKGKAPELMKGHTPATTPIHATNRLLVGPFKSDDEAQAFVNKMAGKGLSGFAVKTARGQKVEKVDTGR